MQLRALLVVVLASVPAVLVACDSDKYNDYNYFGGGFGPTPSTTGTGTTGYPPQQIPPGECESAVVDTSCNAYDMYDPLVCEVGTSPNVACNQTLTCDRYSTWKQTSAPAVCPNSCPPAYTTTAPPGTCEVPNAGRIICEYQEGTCGCAPSTGTKDAGADGAAGTDGGNSANYRWTCVTPDTGCPRTRPRLGTRCVKPMSCDYGACLFEDGIAVTCDRGYYSGSSTSGSGSTSGYSSSSGGSSGTYYYDYGSYWKEDTATGCRRLLPPADAGADADSGL